MRSYTRALGLATGAALGCFGWGLIEASLFTVRRPELAVLPAGGPRLRVLHLADIHLMAYQHRKLQFLASLAELKPDLIVNTGDNLADPAAIAPLLTALEPLAGTPGVFVFGSNDYFRPGFKNPLSYLKTGRSHISLEEQQERATLPTEQLRQGLVELGWQDLNQRRTQLQVAGYQLAFRGTDDAHLERDDYTAIAGPAVAADLNIGLTHAPYLRLLDAMTADGLDLIFAGHTHGGQVCLPGFGAIITNCDIDRARVKGLSQHSYAGKTAQLHISAGLGTSPFAPYRFACRPEVSLLTLTAKTGSHPVAQ